MNITTKINELESELDKLKSEQNRLIKLAESFGTEKQELADKLHMKLCRYNHTDACDYLYGKWTNKNLVYGKQKEIERVNGLLESGLTVEQINKFIELI